eukprot:CAMPEP_0170525586 /NCGR_PEP_ID=MMETSP0209-20121228/11014_1 /TAXON_ID=665100 ORGANISM="Litonotus pictus, Strain P1" /NCGR_SAMPLE_ID=MMETSP0209 /ASSEMBLY_ACC=CAM_ASM_000301 /LENGTH=536 /DNA_ID=CAMNT_0010814885 /DNA_START=105 /DNA_END=1715 /DNA_ORIENTATION=-
MLGTALLVMPCNFYLSGLITSMIGSVIMCLVSYWTANLIIMHSKDDEYDYPLAIRRLLGPAWEKIFNFVSFLLLFLVSIIHFILMANIAYSLVVNISGSKEGWPEFSDITFSQFSMQYMGIILFFLMAGLYSLNSINKILMINDKGIYMIMLYSLYVMYLGIDSLSRGNLEFVVSGEPGKEKEGLQLILFNSEVSDLVGVFAIAYFIHNVVVGMMKSGKDSSKNSRNLGIAYIIVFAKYTILGLFGSFAVAGLYNADYDPDKKPKNIMELLSGHNPFLSNFSRILGIIALFLVFVQLTTVLPILNFFTRRQFFGLILGADVEKISKTKMHLFNLVFNLVCLGFEIAVLEPTIVIAYTGAFGGFILIYVIPILSHIKCMYWGKPTSDQSNENFQEGQQQSADPEKSDVIYETDEEKQTSHDSENISVIQVEELKPSNDAIQTNELSKSENKDILGSGKYGKSAKSINKNAQNTLSSLNMKSENNKLEYLIEKESNNGCRCNKFHAKKYNKILVYGFYFLLLSFGVAILVVSVYTMVK